MLLRLAVFLLATTLLLAPPRQAVKQDEVCRFPGKWEGSWFQSGVRQPIIIEQSRLSTKGRCIASEGDKFVVVDDRGGCFRCVVIHEKHTNVLQYKETFCHARESLQSLCSLITGDALLYSMFRVEATPVECPFKGPLSFTYNRGHGECRSPVSSIDSCTEESRLLLRYQACPDVHGTESTVEELQCLATWKEGSSRYLVGKIHHNHATSNEDRYRCFVYEKSTLPGVSGTGELNGEGLYHPLEMRNDGVDYRVAQSGDATCNGLFSPMEGSRTMTLRKAASPSKCKFPLWLTAFQHWHTLDYRRSYSFHKHNTTLRITNTTAQPGANQHASSGGTVQGYHNSHGVVMSLGLTGDVSSNHQHQEMRVVCTEVKHASHDIVHLVTHFTMGCQSGYVCMMFYRRDGHVIEVQTGSHTRRPEDACQSMHFDRNTLPFITLVTSRPEPRQCPYLGKFSVTGLSRDDGFVRSARQKRRRVKTVYRSPEMLTRSVRSIEWYMRASGFRRSSRDLDGLVPDPCAEEDDFTTLVVGCSTMDTMEFHSECTSADVVSVYSCHGRWEDNGTHYLITTPLSRSSRGPRRYCFMYREAQDGVVHFSSSSDSCRRNISPGISGVMAFNVTSTGQCIETNGAPQLTTMYLPATIAILAVVLETLLKLLSHVER
ncbi:uncharacterized protein LOC110827676 isoform X2 [Zootermopsis nevadensis]|uniref:uncharacterized protein LOC110827676 isoform X2 n=1 Tax=Zootermopsis nevadensis TaxID=136037 RepID=UPI000B8E6948|nr:uncharacterized protein LOC110827676 isoform X2 [Zootermopsis nevadensis]